MDTFQEIRKKGIGGSDIAAIMGFSPYKTALDIYNDKTSEEFTYQDKQCLSRGKKLEKYVLQEYTDFTGNELIYDVPTIQSKEYPFLIGHIDARVIDKNVIVEAKSVGGNSKIWKDEIPIHYKSQIAYYRYLTNADYVDVAALFDRWEFGHFTYYQDQEFEQQIVEAAIRFWQDHVQKLIPPTPTSTEEARKLYNIYSKDITSLDANPRIIEVVNLIKQTQENIKSLKVEEDELKTEVMNFLQNNHIITHQNKKLVSWCNVDTKRFDLNEFKKDQPSLYNIYQNTTTNRVLRIH